MLDYAELVQDAVAPALNWNAIVGVSRLVSHLQCECRSVSGQHLLQFPRLLHETLTRAGCGTSALSSGKPPADSSMCHGVVGGRCHVLTSCLGKGRSSQLG